MRTSSGPAIGSIQLSSPFVQAALSGYSDQAMRRLARRFGAAYTVAEVMIDRFANEARGSGRTARYFQVDASEQPVGAQLMGSDPKQFPPAAVRLVDAGFDVIDINFGCPVKTAMGGCRGGYHLGQPAVALEIIERVRESVPARIPVTLKMRRGIDESAEARDRFWTIFHGAWDRGAAAITLHPRTVQQKYVGPSRWSFLTEAKRAADGRIVLGSGDLFTPEACLSMLHETGVDGVSIARGAIGNPWIFSRALALWRGAQLPPPPSVFEQREVLLEHRRLLEELYGADRWLSAMRKFSFRYCMLHPDATAIRDRFAQARTAADWEQVVSDLYSTDAPGVEPPFTSHSENSDESSCDG